MVRVLCSSVVLANGPYHVRQRSTSRARESREVEKEAERMCGMCVRTGSARRGVGAEGKGSDSYA